MRTRLHLFTIGFIHNEESHVFLKSHMKRYPRSSIHYPKADVLYATPTPWVSPWYPSLVSTNFIPHAALIRSQSVPLPRMLSSRLLLVGNVGKVAATAVLTVEHRGHEDTGTALHIG